MKFWCAVSALNGNITVTKCQYVVLALNGRAVVTNDMCFYNQLAKQLANIKSTILITCWCLGHWCWSKLHGAQHTLYTVYMTAATHIHASTLDRDNNWVTVLQLLCTQIEAVGYVHRNLVVQWAHERSWHVCQIKVMITCIWTKNNQSPVQKHVDSYSSWAELKGFKDLNTDHSIVIVLKHTIHSSEWSWW